MINLSGRQDGTFVLSAGHCTGHLISDVLSVSDLGPK